MQLLKSHPVILGRQRPLKGIPIKVGETLLFFDEIQACPNAIRALRFYHEKMPGLHLVAAGSLLEFALSEIPSFGVGRISNLFLYPLCESDRVRSSSSSMTRIVPILLPIGWEPDHETGSLFYRAFDLNLSLMFIDD